MAFTAGTGTMKMVSTKTRKQLMQAATLLSIVDRSDEARFMAGEERLFMQKRSYDASSPTSKSRSKTSTGAQGSNPTWPDADDVSAQEIVVSLRNQEAKSYAIPHLDAKQSPLMEIENTRRRIAQEIAVEIDQNIRNFVLGLSSTAGTTTNGNAGPVSSVTFGTAGSNYIDRSSPYAETAGTSDEPNLILQVVDDLVLYAKRQNWLDGVAIHGTMPAMIYLVVHPELLQRHVVKPLRDAGYQLDPLTRETLTNTTAFGGQAFTARLGLQNLNIYAPNVLQVPTGTDNWQFWGGYSEAIVGGIGDVLTQIIPPAENQGGIGWLVRQAVAPYYNLLTGQGIRHYTIHAD